MVVSSRAPWSRPHVMPAITREVIGCTLRDTMLAQRRRCDFDRDTFGAANELVWEYHFDEATGATTARRRVPPPDYALRCFVLVRAARQFLYHARFETGADA